MGAIASVLISIFSQVALWLAKKYGLELSIKLAVITAWLAACGVFLLAVAGIQAKLYVAVPGWVRDALDLLPGNTDACIAAIAATYAAAWTYQEITTVITAKANRS